MQKPKSHLIFGNSLKKELEFLGIKPAPVSTIVTIKTAALRVKIPTRASKDPPGAKNGGRMLSPARGPDAPLAHGSDAAFEPASFDLFKGEQAMDRADPAVQKALARLWQTFTR